MGSSWSTWGKKGYPLITRIKELRARNDLTQQQLADLVQVRRETIVFLEKGKYNPSLKLAYEIAQVFKLKIEDVFLLGDEGN